MSNLLQPLAQTFKLVDSMGYYTAEFKRWLDGILNRTGGVTGGIYGKLAVAGGGIQWDLNAAPIAYVTLTASGLTINAINLTAGNLYPYRLQLIQDATGSRTVTWPSYFKFAGGTKPVLSTGAGDLDELWFSSDGTNLYAVTGSGNLR
jgi:hypothetical protein